MTKPRNPLEDAVARHYARATDGLPPPVDPHPGYATLVEAWVDHRRSQQADWLKKTYPDWVPIPITRLAPPPRGPQESRTSSPDAPAPQTPRRRSRRGPRRSRG
jgi:hypothetical protein